MTGCKAMAALPTPKLTPVNKPRPQPMSADHLVTPVNPALTGIHSLFPASAPLPLGVAYSGGADSTALLLAVAERWPGQVQALHVHHGLQAAADDFVRVCTSVCAKVGVPLHVVQIDARHAPGESPEDAARRARYAALATAAMAQTNIDERYTRNRIRARLLPALAQAFPQFRATFARSARHAAQAQAVLLEVAAQDLAAVGMPPAIKALQTLSQPRQANVLRHWLLLQHATPSAAQLEQLLHQIAVCTTRGHRIHLKVAAGHVTRLGGKLLYTVLPGMCWQKNKSTTNS